MVATMAEQQCQSSVSLDTTRIQRAKAPVYYVQQGAIVPREDLNRLLLVPRVSIAQKVRGPLYHVQ
jgi:hypothetical protein